MKTTFLKLAMAFLSMIVLLGPLTVVAQDAPTTTGIISTTGGETTEGSETSKGETTTTGAIVPVVVTPTTTGATTAVEKPAPSIKDAKVPETDAEVGNLIGSLLDASKNGHWLLVIGIALLLIVFVLNKLGLAAKIGRNKVPWFNLGLAAIAALGVAFAGGGSVMDALKLAAIEGGLAVLLWEAIAKHLTSKKSDQTPREA